MPYPIELFQCGHGIPIASPPPSPPSPRTGRTSHGGSMRKQKEEVELATTTTTTTTTTMKLRVASRTTAGGAAAVVVVVRVDGGGGGGTRKMGGSGTALARGEESTLKMAQRKGRRGGVVLETLWPFAAVAEGLAEVEWEGGGDGEMEAGCDSFMFARGGCPREGCRGGVEEDWERVGVYDEDDLRDLVSLREWVCAMEREAVAAIHCVRGDATRAEEERTQEAGRKGKDDMRGRPLSRQLKIFSTLREEFCRLCGSVRDGKRSSRPTCVAVALVGIRQRPPGIGKKEGQESRQVMAQKQLPRFSSHSSADYVTGHRVLSQLSMARMCLEQAEMLAVMQAPKGWFEACLRHVLEELERM